MKTGYHNQTCFKAVMFGKKAVLLYHKNLTVKIVMPLLDYKAQYSVKINIFVFFSFIYFFFIEESGCETTALKSKTPTSCPDGSGTTL